MNKVIRAMCSQVVKIKKEGGRGVLLQSHCVFSTIVNPVKTDTYYRQGTEVIKQTKLSLFWRPIRRNKEPIACNT